VAVSVTPGSPIWNPWPARPGHVAPRHILDSTSLRALCRVPSDVLVCSYESRLLLGPPGVAVLALEADAKVALGTTEGITVRRVFPQG
jgi:hypothetical protein